MDQFFYITKSLKLLHRNSVARTLTPLNIRILRVFFPKRDNLVNLSGRRVSLTSVKRLKGYSEILTVCYSVYQNEEITSSRRMAGHSCIFMSYHGELFKRERPKHARQ